MIRLSLPPVSTCLVAFTSIDHKLHKETVNGPNQVTLGGGGVSCSSLCVKPGFVSFVLLNMFHVKLYFSLPWGLLCMCDVFCVFTLLLLK